MLSRGYLIVNIHNTSDRQRVRYLLEGWCLRYVFTGFAECLAARFPRVEQLGFGYPKLHNKHGDPLRSCTPSGSLNLRLIQVPKPLIDYVILQELCHLKELNQAEVVPL